MTDLRIGIAGLGAAARLVLPYLTRVEGVRLAGAADTRTEARAGFERDYGLAAFDSVEALCRSGPVDAVWIETPNHLHCEHTLTAARLGLHVICAKPLATTLEDCDRMIAATKAAGVQLLVGHSKTFDAPVRAMREVVASGRLGRVIQVDTLIFNDWLRRPRLAAELDETLGAGFVLRQAPHPVEIVTYITGARPLSLRASAGAWAPDVASAGNCAALIAFEGGAFATIAMNGYGYFDSAELTFGIGSMGDVRPRAAPRARSGALDEAEKYAADASRRKPGAGQPFFGLTIVSCERGVIRQSPEGLLIYSEDGCEEIDVPPNPGRAAELIELRDALRNKRDVFPDGAWGKATLEACLGILQSAREGRDVPLMHQVASPP
jgi:phthalate 4,5-cis-dihydrodiol dehydrogenase